MFTSFRARLLATYVGLIVIGFGLLSLWAGYRIAQGIYTNFGNTLETLAAQTAGQIGEAVEEGGEHFNELAPIVNTNSVATGAQISVFNSNSIFVLASDQSVSQLYTTTTPVVAINSAGVEMMFGASPIFYEGDELGIVQFGLPYAIPQSDARQNWILIGIGYVVFTLLGLFASLNLINRLTAPLQTLGDTATALAAGDLGQRVPDPADDEIGAVGKSFNQMADEIEAMVAEQRAFASNASHELRTPLTGIRIRTEALLDAPLSDADQRLYIEEVDQEAQRLSGLVDDLILLSRVDSNRLTIGQEKVDMLRVVQAELRTMQTAIDAKDLVLSINSPAEATYIIQANLNHVRTVMRNVISNAVKYTPAQGEVQVELSTVENAVQVKVSDTGVGITADDLPNIGKRFFRTDKAHSRKTSGVGLGLSLVKAIVATYAGTFSIASTGAEQGTTVTLLWPLYQETLE